MVLTYSHWITRVPWYSGYPPSEIDFAYKAITLFRPVFQPCSAIDPSNYAGPKPHRNKFLRFGLFRFRSPLLTKSLIYFLFLRVLRCFSSPGSLLPHYLGSCGDTVALPTVGFPIRKSADGGFPHSEICGSRLICSSPQLIAACHVLLRRLVPRHPPYALISFNLIR